MNAMEQKQNGMPTGTPAMSPKKSSMRMWVILIIIVVLIGGFFIYKGNQEDGFGDGGVIITRLQNNGDELVLGEVTLPDGGGYVVVYEKQTDSTRTVFGSSALLPAGNSKNVVVKKRRSGGGGSSDVTYVAVAHKDDGDGVFDEETDTPYLDENGEEVAADIELEDEALDNEGVNDDVMGDDGDSDDTAEDGDDDVEVMVVPEGATVVSYTNDGFSPNPLTINRGDTVYFTNNSNHGLWVASAVHPTHEEYPGSGIDGCDVETLVAIFDSCEAVAIGGSWAFTFDHAGEWNYHNHVKAEEFGTIVVEEVAAEESDDEVTEEDEKATTTPEEPEA